MKVNAENQSTLLIFPISMYITVCEFRSSYLNLNVLCVLLHIESNLCMAVTDLYNCFFLLQ